MAVSKACFNGASWLKFKNPAAPAVEMKREAEED